MPSAIDSRSVGGSVVERKFGLCLTGNFRRPHPHYGDSVFDNQCKTRESATLAGLGLGYIGEHLCVPCERARS